MSTDTTTSNPAWPYLAYKFDAEPPALKNQEKLVNQIGFITLMVMSIVPFGLVFAMERYPTVFGFVFWAVVGLLLLMFLVCLLWAVLLRRRIKMAVLKECARRAQQAKHWYWTITGCEVVQDGVIFELSYRGVAALGVEVPRAAIVVSLQAGLPAVRFGEVVGLPTPPFLPNSSLEFRGSVTLTQPLEKLPPRQPQHLPRHIIFVDETKTQTA